MSKELAAGVDDERRVFERTAAEDAGFVFRGGLASRGMFDFSVLEC